MGGMDLADFLLARIAEDEFDAQYIADNGPWTDGRNEAELVWQVHTGPYGDTLTVGYTGNRDSGPTARHIARHDPARVLAECKTKRLLVSLYATTGGGWESATEQMLQMLALPYADHLDYRNKWAL